jgi:hypothetical protein
MTYRTESGRVLSDADVEALADEAERGYEPEQLISLHDHRTAMDGLDRLYAEDDGIVHDEEGT